MNLQHVNLKIALEDQAPVDLERVIEVFHGWVANQVMDELLIDVADYRHVPAGPGVVLVGLEADYALDQTDDRAGLRYNMKARLDGENEGRILHSLRAAAKACTMLEAETELRFDRRDLEVWSNDRALSPNTEQTQRACDLPALLRTVLGTDDFQLQYQQDPRRLFGARVKLAQPLDLNQLVS